MSRPRIVLADDHRIFAEGLKSLLDDQFDVVGIAEDGLALLDAVDEHAPDLVVADLSMPGMNGIECARRLREVIPELRVVLLTMHDDVSLAAAAIRAGAAGYVLKHGGTRDVLLAVEEALRGGVHISPRIAEDVRRQLATSGAADPELGPPVVIPAAPYRDSSSEDRGPTRWGPDRQVQSPSPEVGDRPAPGE